MKEENKKSKKKIILTYVILAVCLLVIAAITLTVVFTVNRKPEMSNDEPVIEQPDNNDGDKNNNDNTGGNTDVDDKPTGGETGYKIPVENATVSTSFEFGQNGLGQYRVHKGLDFEGSVGDAVCAVFDGKITKIVSDSKIGENYITISHVNGVTSTYTYIDAKSGLKEGDSVKRGQVIGTISAAGGYEVDQGEHLHFEMSVNGKYADPETYLDLIEK